LPKEPVTSMKLELALNQGDSGVRSRLFPQKKRRPYLPQQRAR
jgi:hypothetical protein